MANINFGEELKKIVLAGVGAAAVTAEKAEQLINYCVEKGEITVEQGKVMNEELRRNVKDGMQTAKEKVQATKDRFQGKVSLNDLMKSVDNLSPEDLQALKDKIAASETPGDAAATNADSDAK
ncbi:phasin family protein [Pseudoramibacter alactolyticus]|uniref:phasin family protein n=1 Tax=Pseudoramibacter alactolyticus TaxID=113287 RepID=UPI002354D459|nr:phasin family protein [Pseudoramibacter alactolyticus]MBM6968501.1 phasin family protein [Pseudoramibacter alactolyticus]